MNASLNARRAVAMTAGERRATVALALILALRLFGLFVLLPVLALHVRALPGGTPLLAGLAVGAYGITQALLQVPAGLLSDRIGRKRVIVAGLLVFAAGSLLAATSDSVTGIIAGRILQGAGAISAAVTALAADLTRDPVRTRVMAVVGVSIGAAFLVALALGPVLAAAIGVSGLFWLGALLAGVALAVTVAAPGGWSPPATVAGSRWSDGLADPGLYPVHLGVFLLHAILTATFVAVPTLLQDVMALPAGGHSRVYFLAMLLSLAGTVPLVLAFERLGRPLAVLAVAIVFLGLGQLGLLAAGVPAHAILALALFFAGFNFLEARLPARLGELAGPAARGGAFGVFATSQFLGAFAGGLGGGLLLGGGWEWVAVAAAAAAGLWLLVLLLARR